MGKTKELVTSLMKETGLNQSEFGKKYGGIPQSTIQRWLSGSNEAPGYVLRMLEAMVKWNRKC